MTQVRHFGSSSIMNSTITVLWYIYATIPRLSCRATIYSRPEIQSAVPACNRHRVDYHREDQD